MNGAAENIEWIRLRWDQLMDSRLAGSPRPWRQPTLTAEQRARLDAQARIEKLERGAFVLGESEPPVRLDTLDKAMWIAARLQALTVVTATELHHQAVMVKAARVRHNTAPEAWCAYLAMHLDQLTEGTTETIRQETRRIRNLMAAHFAEVFDGQRLKTDCPWCRKPRLFIRMIGPDGRQEPIIACESGVCEPPSQDCGTWYRNRPAWPFHEWDWLANRINHEGIAA